ncbi:trypsin-like peptidase domain-containing protein [Candidatus Daviesbacteria bacterium]|nr:trypsin-like peptidase domain-containing protein [Candidatus Daviesbacteria bacterium]
MIVVVIFQQRSQVYRSKAASPSQIDPLSQTYSEFTLPKTQYKIKYDQRQWKYDINSDELYGSRVIFTLNKDYGYARLDILEGESEKNLEDLKDEIIKRSNLTPHTTESTRFKNKPSHLVTYKEQVLGEDVYYYQHIIKNNNNFIIIEERVPQLGYNKSFTDNLLENISIANNNQDDVKGVSDSKTNLTTVDLVDLIRPSIANIVYTYCLEINNLKPALSGLSNPQYNFCGFGKGSGFVVNEKGIVATNGHVVKIYPEEGLITNLLHDGNKAFSMDLIKGIYISKGQNPTISQIEEFYREINLNPQYLDRFLTEIFRLIDNKIISINISNEKYYVNVGNEPIKANGNTIIPSATTYTAKIIDSNYPNKYSYDAIINKNYKRGADVAILQIENTDLFPALKLENVENLREGVEIIIAGYPTLVEGQEDPRAAISYKTSTKPTITRGIISAIKEDLSGKTVFQTDASIDHGNSGGPAFNLLGDVIGIATFSVESQSGNFNFLREAGELKELMSKNNIDNELDKISSLWREGLSNFRSYRFGQALKIFKEVEVLNPNHPTVKEIIDNSQNALEKGESLEGLAGFIKGEGSNALLILLGSISLISFMSAGFLGILPLFTKNNVANVN